MPWLKTNKQPKKQPAQGPKPVVNYLHHVLFFINHTISIFHFLISQLLSILIYRDTFTFQILLKRFCQARGLITDGGRLEWVCLINLNKFQYGCCKSNMTDGMPQCHFLRVSQKERKKNAWCLWRHRGLQRGVFIFLTILQRVFWPFSSVPLTQQPSICMPQGLFIHYKPSSRLIWRGKEKGGIEYTKILMKTQLLQGADSV